ncbi:MAG: lactonase family protein [Spongiibacteraceae bacterium]|jgi:6-phosphogluconolactonase|nr:lactonase family protein [Spongiibacteraceae bacterium]
MMYLYFGTFTGGFMGGAPSEGIYVWQFDPDSLEARPVQTVGGLFSPSFLCKHPTLPRLYAAERQLTADDNSTGALATYAIGGDGQLSLLDRRSTEGAFTAHVNISADGRLLSVANPLGPTVTTFPVDANGVPGTAAANPRYEGKGARPRQSAPWPHSSYTDPSGERLFVCDLGLDRVFIYDIDKASGSLTPAGQPFAQVSSGAGARHMAVHPSGQFLCVVNELDSTLSVFAYDAEAGSVIAVQTLSTLPADFEGASQPAEVAFDAEGKYLYITNRGAETVTVFAFDETRGRATLSSWVPVGGDTPRHLAIAPDGKFLLVANQLSAEVAVFRRDPASGTLTDTGKRIPVPSVSCTVFG